MRTGRPKANNPKHLVVKARIDEETQKSLEAYCAKTGKSKTDIVREGIGLVIGKKK